MASDKKNKTGKAGKSGELGTTEFGGTSVYETTSSRSSLGKKIAVASAAVAAVGAAAAGVAAVKRRKAASGSDFTATSSTSGAEFASTSSPSFHSTSSPDLGKTSGSTSRSSFEDPGLKSSLSKDDKDKEEVGVSTPDKDLVGV
jgi:hypothetical protein